MPRKRRIPERERKPWSEKPGVSANRFRKDPAFKNSRRAGNELGRASRASTLLRRQLVHLLPTLVQNVAHKKLTKKIADLIREKKTTGAERVRLNKLDWEKLKHFEFNPEISLSALLHVTYKMDIDTAAAIITITLSPLTVMKVVEAMPEIQYLRIVAGVTAVDFDNGTADSGSDLTGYISKNQPGTGETTLSVQLKSPVLHPLFIALGFTCFLKVNENYYELYNLRFRALSLIHVLPAAADKVKITVSRKPKKAATKAAKPVKKSKTVKKKRK